MASIRKRGSSYLIVVSMGYDYNGKRIRPQQKTVHPPEELTPRQVEKWLNEQAVLFERDCRHAPQPVQQLTLAKYIDLWLTDIAPGKLAKSTIRRDRQDIERILPALGHYKLTELRPEHFRNFYAELRKVTSIETKKPSIAPIIMVEIPKNSFMPNIQNTSQKKKEPIPQYTRMGNTYSVNMPSRIPAKFRSKYSPKITAKPIKMISIVDCK